MKKSKVIIIVLCISLLTGCTFFDSALEDGGEETGTLLENDFMSETNKIKELNTQVQFFEKIDISHEELSLMQSVLLNKELFSNQKYISFYMDNDDFINEYCKFWIVDLDEDEINEVCIYYESGGVLICHESEGNVEAYVVGSNAFGPVYTDGTFEGFGATSNQGDLCGNVSFENETFEYDVLTWWEDSYETMSRHYFKGIDRVEISKEEYDQIMSQYPQEKVTQYDFTIENILKYVQ